MKSVIAMAVIGLAALGAATSASAYKFSPVSTVFSGSGPAGATLSGVSLTCTGNLKGTTNASGGGKVTSGSFSGTLGCNLVTLAGMPWTMTATGATTASVANVDFVSPIGSCGAGTLNVTISGGVINYHGNFGRCTNVSLTLTTTPSVSIVP